MSRPHTRFACKAGFHRRTAVIHLNHRNYSECGHCGVDLVRSRRGWRELRADELPEGWSHHGQHAPRWRLHIMGLGLSIILCVCLAYLLHAR